MSVKGITTIDCDYLLPRFAASYLVQEGEAALFIDNNTTHSVPLLLKALKKSGLTPEQVRYVIITHVHLDHAGGSSALMKACPNAVLLAHPRAATHLIDPSKLVRSARKVYGAEKFEQLYGVIEPIEAWRVRSVADDEQISLGSKTLRFIFTRGHANHHMCIEMSEGSDRVIFTGDAFGLAYPDLQETGLFILPSTSPTDFDASEARRSIQKILSTGATEAFLTHFGGVTDLEGGASQLISLIDLSEQWLEEARISQLPDEQLKEFCLSKIRTEIELRLRSCGMTLTGDVAKILDMDLELNAQGLAYVAIKRRHAHEPIKEKR
jgi:glyoxylase-like metal-dependent hydrolase (beta-lactamase superfamily II)